MSESRNATNWLSLRKRGQKCLLQVTLQAGGDGSLSVHRPLTLAQLEALIGHGKRIAKELREDEDDG